MEKQSNAESATAESTVEDAAVSGEESFETFEEPTGAQLAEAQREMERALKDMKNKSSGDSTLSRYFREMANHPVLTPQQEVEAAKEVERLEIGYWKALFSYAPACETTAVVLEAQGRGSRGREIGPATVRAGGVEERVPAKAAGEAS